MDLEINYKIKDSKQGSLARLSEITNRISCTKCKQNLILCNFQENQKIILIKALVHIFDIERQELLLKCGKCHNFNSILLKDIKSGKMVFKLII